MEMSIDHPSTNHHNPTLQVVSLLGAYCRRAETIAVHDTAYLGQRKHACIWAPSIREPPAAEK